MSRPRVLISDKLSPAAVAIFEQRGIETHFQPDLGKDKEALAAALPGFDGLAIRSTTKVGPKLLAVADGLKVIGRAGSGVDNIDVPAATGHGVVVMNTPFGNSITTAEHSIAMILALARHIPTAAAATRAGKWEKGKYLGVELTGKCLGIIGCGAVGSIVADRALGLRMRVVAYDPFLSAERAVEIGVEKVELDAILELADFVTLHTPLTPQTHNVLSAEALARTKRGVRIVNCARGGLVDEEALLAGLDSGHIEGAALDVLVDETNPTSPLMGHPKVICTPHLGASTHEAQENVALQIAEQMAEYLLRGAITNALNAPSMTAEEAPKLKPFIALADRLGAFGGQLARGPLGEVRIIFEGDVAERKTKALTAAILAGLLRPVMPTINVVSAPGIAHERGIRVDEVIRAGSTDYESLITLQFESAGVQHALVGTVFHDGKPRLVKMDGIEVDCQFGPQMLYVRNEDKPGFIGRLASAIGEAGLNIATFALGREREGGFAIALIEIDGAIPPALLAKIAQIKDTLDLTLLKF